MQSSVLSSLSTSPSLARYSDREHSRPSQLSSITASSTQSSSTSSALDSATGTHNDHGDVVRKSIRNENPGKWKIYNKPKLIIRLTTDRFITVLTVMSFLQLSKLMLFSNNFNH